MLTLQNTIVLVETVPMDYCALCGTPIPANGCPLCPECDEEERSLYADYRAEQEQARHPF